MSLPEAPSTALLLAESSSSLDLPDAPGRDSDQQTQTQQKPTADQSTEPTPGQPQQTKRILGIMPNFSSVSADTKLPPLSAKEKFILAGKNTFDYSSFFIAAIQAGWAMGSNSYPQFHQGVAGYGRYYWHTLADTATSNFMVAGVVPVIAKQDPRFYTLGHGGFKRRAAYAVTRIFVARTDGGTPMPNFGEIVGTGAAAGISSLYYPSEYRTWTKVGQKWLTNALIDGSVFTFKEFWPDINHKIFHTK